MSIVSILILGGLGALIRAAVVSQLQWGIFPLATLLVNLIGSFAIGWAYSQYQSSQMSPLVYSAVALGLLGALTTYSSFSLDTVKLLVQGAYGSAALYILATNLCCIGACYAGFRMDSLQ